MRHARALQARTSFCCEHGSCTRGALCRVEAANRTFGRILRNVSQTLRNDAVKRAVRRVNAA
eukprot:7671841-Lingulodinium_polyedra.AAC.1